MKYDRKALSCQLSIANCFFSRESLVETRLISLVIWYSLKHVSVRWLRSSCEMSIEFCPISSWFPKFTYILYLILLETICWKWKCRKQFSLEVYAISQVCLVKFKSQQLDFISLIKNLHQQAVIHFFSKLLNRFFLFLFWSILMLWQSGVEIEDISNFSTIQ